MIAIPSANKKATIIAISILADADGFLPTARIAAKPINPTTIDGPSVLKIIIRIMIIFLIFLGPQDQPGSSSINTLSLPHSTSATPLLM